MEPSAALEVQSAPKTEPTPEPVPEQTVVNPQLEDMVCVEGFGWLECRRAGEAIYAEDMYETGNKIGSMG